MEANIQEDVLNNKQKITDVMWYLNQMQKDRFIRLLRDTELGLIKNYLTEDSWKDLLEFKEQNMQADVLCDECGEICRVEGASESYECQKCLLFFHSFCRKIQLINEHANGGYVLCLSCSMLTKNTKKVNCRLLT